MNFIHRIRIATGEAVSTMLADLGLNGTLALIVETLDETGPVSAAEIARRTLVTRQALTDPLNELQRRGFVDRPPVNANAHTRPVALTDEGRALAETLRERMHLIEDRAISDMTAGEVATLRSLLARYASGWEQLAADSGELASIANKARPESAARVRSPDRPAGPTVRSTS
ncbi:MarR family transcriptional regulator [Acrocarpospora sp. B8E8]|uniref:MarR family winged helix-turn-helix transcriptional regulator n=1 Tax=Acrocarpospora sp. B8E8 TaxID=3153572 RepID=UPI00325EEF64